MLAHDIIIKPVLTEKSYTGIQDKKYTFVVAKGANKTEIKKAVEEVFNVQVESVNTLNVRGKRREWARTRATPRRTKRQSCSSRKTARLSNSSNRCPKEK